MRKRHDRATLLARLALGLDGHPEENTVPCAHLGSERPHRNLRQRFLARIAAELVFLVLEKRRNDGLGSAYGRARTCTEQQRVERLQRECRKPGSKLWQRRWIFNGRFAKSNQAAREHPHKC